MADPWIADSIKSASRQDMLGGDDIPEYIADCERLTAVAQTVRAALRLARGET